MDTISAESWIKGLMLSCLQYTRLLRMGNFFTRSVLSIPMVLDERVRVKRFPPSAPLS